MVFTFGVVMPEHSCICLHKSIWYWFRDIICFGSVLQRVIFTSNWSDVSGGYSVFFIVSLLLEIATDCWIAFTRLLMLMLGIIIKLLLFIRLLPDLGIVLHMLIGGFVILITNSSIYLISMSY